MKKLEIEGIWKGEYVYDDRFQPVIVKTVVPFILKIRTVDDHGLFEGMCQDDPAVSQIDFHADIYGKLEDNQLTFTKRYPKTILKDRFEKLVRIDEPLPDILYQAKLGSNGRVLGTWRMEKTFRKVDGKVLEIGGISGVWWMHRM